MVVRYVGTVWPDRDWAVTKYRNKKTPKPLALRLEIANHSPTGFAWGYAGSGPAQLALALIVDATGRKRIEPWLYQRFKSEVIANLPQSSGWEMTQDEVRDWVRRNESKRDAA